MLATLRPSGIERFSFRQRPIHRPYGEFLERPQSNTDNDAGSKDGLGSPSSPKNLLILPGTILVHDTKKFVAKIEVLLAMLQST